MDVPLALTDIGNRNGSKEYERKSLTFCHRTDVMDFFVFIYLNVNYTCI